MPLHSCMLKPLGPFRSSGPRVAENPVFPMPRNLRQSRSRDRCIGSIEGTGRISAHFSKASYPSLCQSTQKLRRSRYGRPASVFQIDMIPYSFRVVKDRGRL